jgi:hypothetical protein
LQLKTFAIWISSAWKESSPSIKLIRIIGKTIINTMNIGVKSCAIPNQITANTSHTTGGVVCIKETKGLKI